MATFAIQNFRFGIDTRRSLWTAQPGSLTVLDNAFVNEGGEIEKRLGFQAATGLASTYGLLAGTNVLYVFTSVDPGGFPATLFGVTVDLILCVHPSGLTDAPHLVNKVISATLFNSSPDAIVQFANGDVYKYNNGVLDEDFVAGEVLAYQTTNAQLATALAALINANSPTYTANAVGGGVVDVFNNANAAGSGYTITITDDSAAGTLTSAFLAGAVPSVVQNAAVGSFSIVQGSVAGGGNVNSVKVQGKYNTITQRSRALVSAVYYATLTTATAHGFAVGDYVVVQNMTAQSYNTTGAQITAVTSTTFTYVNGAVVEGTVADTTGAVMDIGKQATITHAAANTSVATITTAVAHGFTTGDEVSVLCSAAGAAVNTPGIKIASTPTSTTFTYYTSAANFSIVACTGTAFDYCVFTEILGAAVPFNNNQQQTAINVAQQINIYQLANTTYFKASASNGSVNVVTTIADVNALFNGMALRVTAGGDLCVGQYSFTVTGPVVNNIITAIVCNGVNILSGFTGSQASTLSAQIAEVSAYINSVSGTTGILSYAVPGAATMYLSQTVTSNVDGIVNVVITPASGIGISTGNTVGLTAYLGAASLVIPLSGGGPGYFYLTLTSSNCIVIVSGGQPPYQLLWSWQSGGAGIGIINATSQYPTFHGSAINQTGVVILTVTDALNNQSVSTPLALTTG